MSEFFLKILCDYSFEFLQIFLKLCESPYSFGHCLVGTGMENIYNFFYYEDNSDLVGHAILFCYLIESLMEDKAAKFSQAFFMASSRDWLLVSVDLDDAGVWGSNFDEVFSCPTSFFFPMLPRLNMLVS